jgi:hypothetical protein
MAFTHGYFLRWRIIILIFVNFRLFFEFFLKGFLPFLISVPPVLFLPLFMNGFIPPERFRNDTPNQIHIPPPIFELPFARITKLYLFPELHLKFTQLILWQFPRLLLLTLFKLDSLACWIVSFAGCDPFADLLGGMQNGVFYWG